MLVKVIKAVFQKNHLPINIGEQLQVRPYPDGTLLNLNRPYQVTEGIHSGRVIPKESCIEVEDKKVYSEKEWNDLKEHYHSQIKKEKDQLIIFQNLARDLTDTVKKKNQEIDKLNFFLESSNLALRAACEAIETLKAKS